MGIVWWLWFRNENENYLVREHLIAALVGCFVALFIARILLLTLPFRIRPSSNPHINFLIPYGMKAGGLAGGSTFPSDHAVLFSTLAFSFWFISKKLGVFAIIYVFIVIFFPRIYLGLHYPTDILAGTVLGFAIAFIFNSTKTRQQLAKPFFYLMNHVPGLFYFIFFLISYQLVVLFYDFREIATRIFKYLLIFNESLQRIIS
jgi:undecaprenyl-diphosphatase